MNHFYPQVGYKTHLSPRVAEVEDLLFGPLGAPRVWPGAIRSARRASEKRQTEKRFQYRKWLEMAMEWLGV